MEFFGNGQFTKCEPSKRVLTINGQHNPVSYWEHGEEIFRLNEYEPVQFDVYGVPLGARWECNVFLWPDAKKLILEASEELSPFEMAMLFAKPNTHVALREGYGYHYGQDFGRLTGTATGTVEQRQGSKIYVRPDADTYLAQRVHGYLAVFDVMAIDTAVHN